MNPNFSLTLLFAAWASLAAACGSATVPETCDPGTTQGCRCPGGASGVQACAADGSGWETCDCDGADADADADGDDVPPDTVGPDADADDVPPDTAGPDADADADTTDVVTPPDRDQVDLLFVVDNSFSMEAEQVTLMAAMPGFLDALFDRAAGAGLDLDLNVGVVSTDMGTHGYSVTTCSNPMGGDQGCLLHAPRGITGCDESYPTFLHRAEATAGSYTTAAMAEDVACIGTLGTAGCAFEQPLEAAVAALTTNAGAEECNAGFLRPSSLVLVVFLSDENDCSVAIDHAALFDSSQTDLGHLGVRCGLNPDYLIPVDRTIESLASLESADHAVFVAAIIGVPTESDDCVGFGDRLTGCLELEAMAEQIDPGTPERLMSVCESAAGAAAPGRRFVELARALGRRAHVSSICQGDYAPALRAVAEALF